MVRFLKSICALSCTAGLLLYGTMAAAAETHKPQAVSSSPFGVVCPWPGMEKAGIKWCRMGAGATSFANWPDIQPSADVWDWSRSDGELKTVRNSYGVSVLPILGYTPKWASQAPDDPSAHAYPPKDLATYARFVRECVARYKDQIKVWEVWNEPNIGFLNGSIADYANMVKTASVAAKQVDPECRIAIGCAGVDNDYLQRLYEFGCGPFFDVMSVHPYQWGKELNANWMREKLEGCRTLMNRYGDADKEIWITEQGWSLSEGVTADEQADLLIQAMTTALSQRERLKLEKYFWFCVKDWGTPSFGLFDVDGKPKPAFTAYQTVTTELSQAKYCGVLKVPNGVFAHVFEQSGKPVVVLWSVALNGKIPVELATKAKQLSIRSKDNKVNALATSQGKATVEATHAPVFVRGLAMSDLTPTTLPAIPADEPRQRPTMVRDVWFSIVPASKTVRPCAALGGPTELSFEVHNNSEKPAQGKLQLELVCKEQTLAQGEIGFDAAAGQNQTVAWQPTIAANEAMIGELATLKVQGRMAQAELAPLEVPVRLSHGKSLEFTSNSWIEHFYLYKAEKTGAADSVRFGSEFGYRFELGDAKSAQLRINVGANAANAWNLLVSTDDKEYTTVQSGKSWPSWQTIDLKKHLEGVTNPAMLYVKIQGDDCQVREVILQTDQ
jgi:hypothetical protein